MDFFKNFPTISYAFGDDEIERSIVNISARLKIAERIRQSVAVLHDYVVQDSERPDIVALKVYGSSDYTWLVLLLNNMLSLYDWPLTSDEFDEYIRERYGSVNAAQYQTVYLTHDGLRVDAATWAQLPSTGRSTTNMYEVELQQNEDKRRIKIVPAEFAPILQREMKEALK